MQFLTVFMKMKTSGTRRSPFSWTKPMMSIYFKNFGLMYDRSKQKTWIPLAKWEWSKLCVPFAQQMPKERLRRILCGCISERWENPLAVKMWHVAHADSCAVVCAQIKFHYMEKWKSFDNITLIWKLYRQTRVHRKTGGPVECSPNAFYMVCRENVNVFGKNIRSV